MKTKIDVNTLRTLHKCGDIINCLDSVEKLDVPIELSDAILKFIVAKNDLNNLLTKYEIEKI